MLGPLVERALAMYGPGVLPKYADVAARLALTQIVLPQESGSIEPTASDLNMALAATTLGYVSRVAEFEFIEQPQPNEHLGAFLTYAFGERAFGEDWFANVVGCGDAVRPRGWWQSNSYELHYGARCRASTHESL